MQNNRPGAAEERRGGHPLNCPAGRKAERLLRPAITPLGWRQEEATFLMSFQTAPRTVSAPASLMAS